MIVSGVDKLHWHCKSNPLSRSPMHVQSCYQRTMTMFWAESWQVKAQIQDSTMVWLVRLLHIERVSVKTKHHHHFLPPTACCGSRNHRVDVTASIFLNYLNTIRVHCNPAIQEFWSLHETKHSENYFSRRPAIASWYCLPTLNSRIYQLYSHGTL